MSLQFIIGSSGSGKTRRLYKDLIDWSMGEPDSRFIAIVPEQFTMQTQKDIVSLHPYHGTTNIDIVSFNRLAYRIFEELAVEHLDVLDDMGKSMVLRRVAAKQGKALNLYGGHLNQPGFINQLKSMLSELYQYGIRPEDLENVQAEVQSAMLKAKCQDLALIYRAFQKEIEDKYITSEEILDILCRVLPQSELIKQSVITLDGYTGFTPVQYRLLELMMVHARKVIVTVTMDPAARPYRRGRMQDLFYMGKEIVCRLIDIASLNHVARERDILLGASGEQAEVAAEASAEVSGGARMAFPIRFAASPSIAFIEKHLYRYGRSADWQPREVEVLQASNPAGEVAAVASRIHSLIQNENLRYREIAVITGDLSGYRNEIMNRFQMEQIPCFMDNKKSILENAMVEFIRAALDTVRRDFDYESIFRCLKTGLVTDDAQELDRLENYCMALGIRGWKRWNDTWEYVPGGGKKLNMDQLNMDQLNAFRQEILEPFSGLRQEMRRDDRTVKSMNEAVLACLESCQVSEKLEQYRNHFEEVGQYSLAKEYEQVYDRVVEMLERLTGLLGDEKVSLKEYMEILDAGFGEIQVGVIPATVDRVVVGDITRTRLDQIRVLFFVGVNEGIVPGKKDAQGLLTDIDREMFKRFQVELAPTTKEDSFTQRYYLYLMMTKPSERLIMSYPLSDQSGKSRRPSSLIGEVKRLFPMLEVKESDDLEMSVVSRNSGKEMLIRGIREYAAGNISGDKFENVNDCLAKCEADYEAKKEAAEEPSAGLTGDFLTLYRWFASQPEYADLVRNLTDAAFYSYEKRGVSKAAAQALYGTVLQGSVTRLEKYAACAYAHFLNYGLELMERQEYQIAAVDMGNLFHSSIDRCFKEMASRGLSAIQLSDEQRTELVKECVGQVTAEYGNTILQSSARNQYLAARIQRMTDRTIWALTEQLKKGDFEPSGFEVSFSAADNLQAMKIRLSEEEELHLRGRIDRLDLCSDQQHVYVKIIDYKSGSTQFDLAAVYYGLQLQLVVYMDAVMELAGRKDPGKEVVPAGIFYYNIKDPLVDREWDQTQDDIDAEILRQLKMDGLVNSDLEVIGHLDRQIEKKSDVIPVVMKDGLIQEGKSSVASSRRFEILKNYVRGQLKKDGREILDGRIDVEPHKNGRRTACDYCPYHGICGFDTRISGYRYRGFPAIEAEEIWENMTEQVQDERGTRG